MTQDVERLDFNKPPPGYTISWLTHSSPEWVFRVGDHDDFNQYASEDKARLAAWTHHKARHDPPGMWSGFYGRLPDLKIYTPRMGRVHGMELIVPESEHSTPELARGAGREAAWIRYERWCASGEWFDMGSM